MDHLQHLFPLRTIGDVRRLFEKQLTGQAEPDLVLLSIVVGCIESHLTCSKVLADLGALPSGTRPSCERSGSADDNDATSTNLPIEPTLQWDWAEELYRKFQLTFKGLCDPELLAQAQDCAELQDEQSLSCVRRLIKHVADITWNTLSKSQYKDRPHLQSIYAYLTGNKLDCFGVAFTVVAACQMLRVPHIHLALSEDHAWVVFGRDGTKTAEVTWHGKGNEDKRGLPVDILKAKTSWLYLAGQPVVCGRYLEVASLVSSINPTINANYDSIEVGALQQELLWLLYDLGHLNTYPMALGNLADLEEISPSLGRPSCRTLFEQAIAVDVSVYQNHHVYPYTYLAGYFYRQKEYGLALQTWADAADVIKMYKYSKDDEEIYKEFMEIATELMPSIVKANPGGILSDPKCFLDVIRFFDGICCWEEDSSTPVLHIGWAKQMVATCQKFEPAVRRQVHIGASADEADAEGAVEEEAGGREDNNNCCYKGDSRSSSLECDRMVPAAAHPAIGVAELIDQLSHSSRRHVLNVDFLLGRTNQPFRVAHHCQIVTENASSAPVSEHAKASAATGCCSSGSSTNKKRRMRHVAADSTFLQLFSAKMRGLRGLLCTEKLNTSAIQLQLTAQSQTDHKKAATSANPDSSESRPKRTRRD